MSRPFLALYQDLTKVYPSTDDNGVHMFTCREARWLEWMKERQEGSRWLRAKVRVAGKPGLRVGLEWRETWTCNHAGSYRDRRDANVSPRKTRVGKKSIKDKCPASITATKFEGSDNVEVRWKYTHERHEPASIKDWTEASLAKEVKEWIRERIAEGKNWKDIHSLLRVNERELLLLDKTSKCIPQALRVKRMDVYNILRQEMVASSRRDVDLTTSLEKWVDEVVANGGWGFVSDGGIGLATKWQMSLWDAHTVCLDSTHNTCQGNYYLYTIVVRSKITGQGAPAAIFLSKEASTPPLQDFLERLPMKPAVFMIDVSHAEAGAIANACPDAQILYCNWHVLKAVYGKTVIHIKHKDPLERRRLIKDAFGDFKFLMNLANKDLFWAAITSLAEKWTNAKQDSWCKYVQVTWRNTYKRWGKAFRGDHHDGINTNNYIESWHNRLKTNYLGGIRRQRVDFLIHVIINKVLPDYRQEAKQVEIGLLARTLNKAERAAKRKSLSASLDLVEGNTVQSFNGNGVYQIVDGKCSCLAAKPCKHMFLHERANAYPATVVAKQNNIVDGEKAALLSEVSALAHQIPIMMSNLSLSHSRSDLKELIDRLSGVKLAMSDIVYHRSPSATQRSK